MCEKELKLSTEVSLSRDMGTMVNGKFCVMIGSNRGKVELVKFSEYKMPRIGLTLLAAQFQ